MYKASELDPFRTPWVSRWRFGRLLSAIKNDVVLEPWPRQDVHPLVQYWKVTKLDCEASRKVHVVASSKLNAELGAVPSLLSNWAEILTSLMPAGSQLAWQRTYSAPVSYGLTAE
jgi:hypothetical protein